MNNCCGNCNNGKMYWKYTRQTHQRLKRYVCGLDIPEVEFPPMPFWAEYVLDCAGNDDLLPSDGKNCPCWIEKKRTKV